MKKTIFALLASACVVLSAQASVLTFDTLTPNHDSDGNVMLTSMSNNQGYGGFTWNSNFLLGDTSYAGYANGAHSGSNFVNNKGVNALSISSSTAFDFAGAWFVAPNISGTKATSISISAYNAANSLIGTTGFVSIGNTYSFIAATFKDVSKIVINRDKGFFAMDDFTLADSAVPEPSGLFGVGLAAALLLARRKRAS